MTISRRDLLALGATSAAALGSLGGFKYLVQRNQTPDHGAGKTALPSAQVPTMCQACTTACGMIANVHNGRLLTVRGNPADPNSQGSLCAKGVAAPSFVYDAYRLLFPLKRVGKRGEGKWKRISWDEAYDEMATRLRAIRERGTPEEFAFQQGRNRSTDIVSRFLRAFGTPTELNHRSLCSLNRRAAILASIGDSDWDLGDFENSRYILNFGSNWAEAHQGHIPVAIRMMRARERGAKIVTLDARLSNTAALSDEWLCVKPGTDGLVALAMGNVICSERLWNHEWLSKWSNYAPDQIAEHLRQYSVEFAARESGIGADVIARVAREFAAAAPKCTTISNRGSHAHWNGFYNDRAIVLLNALVGNLGHEGGWCWHPRAAWDTKAIPEPQPVPPKAKRRSALVDAAEYPLANGFKGKSMRVGGMAYQWIKEGRQKVSMLMTYNCDQAWAWPDTAMVQEVLKSETLLPFHVCIDVMYSESAHLADLILPWTTFLERWDIDARPPQGLVDYVGLRQPVVKPLGESKDIREIFPELARRIGGGMESYFPWRTTEEYLEQYYAPIPGGFARMRRDGIYVDPKKKKNYLPYEKELSAAELEGSSIDPSSGIVFKGEDPDTREPVPIGILVDGVAKKGFATPSRKFEVHSHFVQQKGAAVGKVINPLPIYDPIPDHARLEPGHLIMISFKWNVHNAHRTMQSKWLQEIVHSNPAWVNTRTARTLGIRDGDWIEVVGYRPNTDTVPGGDGSELGRIRVRAYVTEGVHPSVIAISHNAGRWTGGPVATRTPVATDFPGYGAARDRDVEQNLWWSGELSVAQNAIMPNYPDPRSGQQAYHDTIVLVRPFQA